MGATLSHQVVCSHCEEVVHRYAARCPYCQHDLTTASSTAVAGPNKDSLFPPPSSKITQLAQPEEVLPTKNMLSTESEEDEEGSLYKFLFPLLALLAGAFFAFFGLLIKLFSKNGKLTLEWRLESWPYYFFPALFLLLLGTFMLTHVERESSL